MTVLEHSPAPDYRCPGSKLILPAAAPRDQWLAERRKGIGGSDASTVAGVNKWSSLYELWLDKTGRGQEKTVTDAMRWGTLLEPILRQAFTEDTGLPVRRAGLMRSREFPWMQVTVDGLIPDGSILETKSVGWRGSGDWADGQVADHAAIQVQHGLAVTGRSHAWVACLPDDRGFLIRRVERDQGLIDLLVELEGAFWADFVLADRAPMVGAHDLPAVKARWNVEGSELKTADDDDLALVAQLAGARAAVRELEKAGDAIEADLRERIGAADALVGQGLVWATNRLTSTERIDIGRLRADLPEIATSYTTTSTSRRLLPLKTPKEI